MQLVHDSMDSVPEDMKENFVSFKDGDKELFMHKDLAEAKKESFRFKGDLTDAKSKLDSVSSKLGEFEAREAEREAVAKQKAEEDALKNGKSDEIIEDYKRKLDETKNDYEKRISEMESRAAQKEKAAIVNDLSGAATETGKAALKRLISQDLDYVDGNLVVLDNDGKATATTLEEYKENLKVLYPSLVSGVQSKGGIANGSTGGGSTVGKTMTREQWRNADHITRSKAAKEGVKIV